MIPPKSTPAGPLDLDVAEAKVEAASDELSRICRETWAGGKPWHWEIPANPARDSDLLLGGAIEVAKAAIKALRALPPSPPAPAGPDALTWTRELPTEAGWYMTRGPVRMCIEAQEIAGMIWPAAPHATWDAFKGCEFARLEWPPEPRDPSQAPTLEGEKA